MLAHLLILASYAAAAAVAGFVVPRILNGIDPLACYLIAGAGFLAAGLLHEVLLRRFEQRELADHLDGALDEIDELRELNHGLMQDLANAREEITVLCDVVEDATDGANQTLVSEMKVLQQQLGRLETVPQPRAGQRRRGRGGAEPAAADADTSGSGQPEAGQVFDGPFEEDEVLAIIREALRTNRIDLYLQPIVSLPQRRTHFYEAMSRLRTGDGRVLMPQHYLDIAVRKGLIATIDNLLLMRCVQLIRRTQQRQKDVSFFVNISPHTLSDTDFLRQFIDFLESNQGLADRLFADLEPELKEWALDRATLHPKAASAADLDKFWAQSWPATVVYCSGSVNPSEAHQRRTADRLQAHWHAMDAGHYPMLSHPDEMARLLLLEADR